MESKFLFVCECGKKFKIESEAVKHLQDNNGYTKAKQGHKMRSWFVGIPPIIDVKNL